MIEATHTVLYGYAAGGSDRAHVDPWGMKP